MIFQSELTSLQSELSQLEMMLTAKRQELGFFQNLQTQTDECLEKLSRVVNHARENTASGAIASLKTAVLTLFADGDGGNDDGGNQPTDPTPDTDPTPFRETKEATTDTPFAPGSIIADANGSFGIVVGRNNLGMRVDWLGLGTCPNPASGKGCWYDWEKDEQAIANLQKSTHDRVKLLTTEELLQFLSWDKEQLDDHWDGEWFEVGIGCSIRWGGATINRWIVAIAESCEWTSPFASHLACQIWEDAPLLGQCCSVSFEQNDNKHTTEMVYLSANCGYLKLKADGRILAAYCWFSRKNIAEAWVQQLEVIPSAKVQMRESKRNSSWKWELKVTGLNVTQIERLSKEPLRQKPKKETPAQAAGIEPPSDWRKPQVKEELPPCPFGIGDIIDWNGCRLRVSAIGVETLHCVLCSDSDGVKPHIKVPISECTLVEEGLDVGDRVEILSDRYLGVKGEEVIVNGVFATSELPIGVELPNGNTRYFPRNELKFLAKAPTSQQPTQTASLQSGSVLLGSKVVTSGNYFGQARANSVNMARMGTADKVAALELVKAGLSKEEALAAVTGADTDYDF